MKTIEQIKQIIEDQTNRTVEFAHTESNRDDEQSYVFWAFLNKGKIEEYRFFKGKVTKVRTFNELY